MGKGWLPGSARSPPDLKMIGSALRRAAGASFITGSRSLPLKRSSPLRLGLIGLASILSGCDYSSSTPQTLDHDLVSGPLPSAAGRTESSAPVVVSPTSEVPSVELDPE